MARRMWLVITALSVLGAANVAAAHPGQRVELQRLEQRAPSSRVAPERLATPQRERAPKMEADPRSRVQVERAKQERVPKTSRQKRSRVDMQRN